MKYLLLFLLVLNISCGDKKLAEQQTEREILEAAPYDTIAVDSFSTGATSVDIAAQIRRSSLKYQDSLNKAKNEAAQAEQLKKAKEAEAKSAEKKKAAQNETKTEQKNEEQKQP